MSINILFTDVSRCDDPKLYIREKFYAAFEELPEFDLDQLVNIAYGEGKPVSLPLAKKEDFPSLTEQQERLIDRKTKLFIAAVERLSPLLDSETKQEDDFVTYLCEDFRNYAKGTPVLVRTTNYSTICYIYENVSVDAMTADVSYQMNKVFVAAGELEIDQHIDVWMKANIPRTATPKAEETIAKLTKGLVGLLPPPL